MLKILKNSFIRLSYAKLETNSNWLPINILEQQENKLANLSILEFILNFACSIGAVKSVYEKVLLIDKPTKGKLGNKKFLGDDNNYYYSLEFKEKLMLIGDYTKKPTINKPLTKIKVVGKYVNLI